MKNEITDYEQDNNFTQVVRGPALDIGQFHTTICREMFQWWNAYAPKGPSYEQFDIVDHLDKAANLFLIAVLPNNQFEYRLHGDEVRRILGYNCAGLTFSREEGTKDLRRFASFLTDLCEKHTPFHSKGTLEEYGKSYLGFESLDIVLSDQNGHPTHILGVLVLDA